MLTLRFFRYFRGYHHFDRRKSLTLALRARAYMRGMHKNGPVLVAAAEKVRRESEPIWARLLEAEVFAGRGN